MAKAVDISCESAQLILHNDFGLSKQSAKWVPKVLHPNQLNIKCELSYVILTKMNSFLE